MTSIVIATRTLSKVLDNGDYLTATAALVHLTGNARPYFSVQGDMWLTQGKLTGYQRFRRHYEQDACGAMHEDIANAFPELAPVIAVHLADDDGVPMYAVANGWYYYSGKARQREESRGESWHNRESLTDVERAAHILHIPASDIPAGMNRDDFEVFCESLRPRWAAMASTARAVIDSDNVS